MDFKSPLDTLIETIPLIDVPIGSTLELECRFAIDDRKRNERRGKRYTATSTIAIAKALIKQHFEAKCEIQQSINFMADKLIKQMYFINGEQQKNKLIYYTKRQLTEPIFVLANNDEPEYKISLAYETSIDEFPTSNCTFARVRLRYAIWLDQWRLDLTLVKNVTAINNLVELKNIKSTMLFPITPDNFIEKAPWDYADFIEFELEYIDDVKKLTIDSFIKCNTILDHAINSLHDTNLQIDGNYQQMIYSVAKWIKPRADDFKHKFGMKRLSNQVIELNKNTYLKDVYQHITNYYITDKIDGKRTIIYVDNHKAYAISNVVVELPYVNETGVYIYDCESYESMYYIFDIMVYNSVKLIDMPFSQRLTYFEKASKIVERCRLKPFIRLTDNYKALITKLKKSKPHYETDGIILTPSDGHYNTMSVYKYKPIEKLSIDFLIKKCSKKLLGIKPFIESSDYTLYLLFCGVQIEAYQKLNLSVIKHYDDMFKLDSRRLPNYFPIQFQPSNGDEFTYLYFHKTNSKLVPGSPESNDLNDQIGEFRRVNGKWELMKIRDDRLVEVKRGDYFGNNLHIAEDIWLSYDNPLIIEADDNADDVYFQTNDSSLHKEQRAFNSYVKSEIISQFSDVAWAMDMASGKGQDFFRYVKNRIGSDGGVLFLEIDKTALMELNNRKWEFATDRSTNGRINVLTHQMDLTANYKENIAILDHLPLPQTKFDIIVCNLAFHYFVKTHSTLINVIKFIDHYLKPNGRFIFTSFNGEAVVDLLRKHNGHWSSKIENKYSIKRAYNGEILLPIGQKIKLLLPFSAGEYYEEPLVNAKYIEAEFSAYGFTMEVQQSFSEFLPNYSNSSKLDEDDITYVSLYSYYCLYKGKRLLRDK
jgi:SAM-dependent methyltransferase